MNAADRFMTAINATPALCSVIAQQGELAEHHAVVLDTICMKTGEDYEAAEREVMSMVKERAREFRLSR